MTTTTLLITQEVSAPVEEVWRSWTEPDRLAAWWWPMFGDTTYELDVRVGGRYRIATEAAGIGVHGRFVAVQPPHRLELTWTWVDADGEGSEEAVVVELAARDAGTLVTVRHETDAVGAEDFRQGWTDCLARLA